MKYKLRLAGYILATCLFYLALFYSSTMQYVDYRLLDFFNNSTVNSHTPKSTVVVQIDDKSLQQLGQWPWPRIVTAKLIDKISENKPKAIMLDMVFSEKDKTSPVVIQEFYNSLLDQNITFDHLPKEFMDNDSFLSEVINTSHIILPVFENTHSQSHICMFPNTISYTQETKDISLYKIDSLVCSLPQFKPYNIGHIHVKADNDGILRSLSMVMSHDDILIPGLGLATISNSKINITKPPAYFGDIQINFGDKQITTGSNASILLHPYPVNQYKTISAIDILNGTFDVKDIKDKYVLVGSNALGLDSTYILSDGLARSGIFIYATTIENILNGDTFAIPSFCKQLNLALALLVGLILLYQMIKKQYLKVVYVYIVSILLALVLTYIAWQQYHIYISIGYFVGLLSSYIFILSLIMFIVDYYKDKRFIYEINHLNRTKKRLHNALEKSSKKRKLQKAIIFQQSKMAAMGEMLDYIAHQWSQPLNIVGLQIQNAELSWDKGQINDEYMSKLVEDIQIQVDYMAQTIIDFRSFIKPNDEITYFDINQTIREAIDLLSSLFEPKGIVVDVKYSSESLILLGPMGEFKQVIVSILKNAYDIMNDKQTANPRIQIKIFKIEDKTTITIQDNAGGIAEDIMDKIFDTRFTTKGKSGGTGVGLYISLAIIESKFRGSINVSNADEGAMFTIII